MYYRNKYGELTSIPNTPLAGDDTSAQELRQSQTETERAQPFLKGQERQQTAKTAAADQATRAAMAETQADAQIRAAALAADAVRDAARIRAGGGYAKGGPVIKSEFKHANPTYTKFGKTGDSSLLAKGRR